MLILMKCFRCENLGTSKDSTACLCAMATSLFNVFNKIEFGNKSLFFPSIGEVVLQFLF